MQADDDSALCQTAQFHAYVERMFAPLRPGLAYVRTEDYIINDFEEDMVEPEVFDPLDDRLLLRARTDAIKCVDSMEELMMEDVRYDALCYMKDPNMLDGKDLSWNATNPESLRTNLCGFADAHIGIWEELQFPVYCETLATDPSFTESERALISAYVKSFAGSAHAAIPYHIQDGEEEIYYDSATTEEEGV